MPYRIGIALGKSRKLNVPAVKFLALRLNTLQNTFQYEFLTNTNSVFARLRKAAKTRANARKRLLVLAPLERLLRGKKISDEQKKKLRPALGGFLRHYKTVLQSEMRGFTLAERRYPNYFVLITVGRFEDEYYSMREGSVSILALGDWKRRMAPPSLLESVLTLLLRESVAAVSPSLRGSVHLGTRGCLCDFTSSLNEARFKVLQGFLCDHCRASLARDGHPRLAAELPRLLEKRWLSKQTRYTTPAGIASKLGYELFLTKGFKANPWEKAFAKLREESVKEALKIVLYLLITLLLGFEWFKNNQLLTQLMEKLKH